MPCMQSRCWNLIKLIIKGLYRDARSRKQTNALTIELIIVIVTMSNISSSYTKPSLRINHSGLISLEIARSHDLRIQNPSSRTFYIVSCYDRCRANPKRSFQY